ncbi:MAG: cupin domain-containing protein [Dehalococcoidia bacterium]
MQITRQDRSAESPAGGAIFTGEVYRRGLVAEDASKQLHMGLVRFVAGGRNVFHTHTFDQVLYITEGEGIVATEHEEHNVKAGDTIVIPAGEKHWHGAAPTTSMAHLAIGTPGKTEVVG